MARPGGLGKGLGALIPAGGASEITGGGLDQIPVSEIRPNPHQPRVRFDEEALASLADSIREVGVLQPILVRPLDSGYELIAGERRWRAARRAGLATVPALVRVVDEVSTVQHAIVENVQREELNSLEEAAGYQELVEDFGLTHEEVATRVGKSRASVSNTLRLLQLPPAVQRFLQEGSLRMGHARALLGTPDRVFQEQMARQIVAEDMSVRSVEVAVRAHSGIESISLDAQTPQGPKLRPPGILELEELLGDHLETRVKISMGPKLGKVVIDFATLEDLERIYRLMSEGVPATTSA